MAYNTYDENNMTGWLNLTPDDFATYLKNLVITRNTFVERIERMLGALPFTTGDLEKQLAALHFLARFFSYKLDYSQNVRGILDLLVSQLRSSNNLSILYGTMKVLKAIVNQQKSCNSDPVGLHKSTLPNLMLLMTSSSLGVANKAARLVNRIINKGPIKDLTHYKGINLQDLRSTIADRATSLKAQYENI